MKECYMTNMNEVIAGNISRCLNHLGKKQNELAEAVHLPKQTISKMLNGSRMISAPELKAIADFCKTTMDKLVQIPEQFRNNSPVTIFMGRVSTDAAKQSLKTADRLMDIYLFNRKYQTKEYKENCSREWSDA